MCAAWQRLRYELVKEERERKAKHYGVDLPKRSEHGRAADDAIPMRLETPKHAPKHLHAGYTQARGENGKAGKMRAVWTLVQIRRQNGF